MTTKFFTYKALMNNELKRWQFFYKDPQFLSLVFVFFLGVVMITLFGFQLVPFFIALIFAYFLEHGITWLGGRGFSRRWSVTLVFGVFLVTYTTMLMGPVPLIFRRAVHLFKQLPQNADAIRDKWMGNPDLTFGLLDDAQKAEFVNFLLDQSRDWLGVLVTGSAEWLPRVTTWIVYLFLVPLVVFFFLKDKERLIAGVVRCLPRKRELVTRIWGEMEGKMGNYVRGKMLEIFLVGVVTIVVFALLGFQYPLVMGALSGISVLIPYVGALAIGLPVFLQGYLQWGWGWDLGWLLIAYAIIQFVDGNIVVPYIFSEAVQLHPVLILFAVLLFGSLWGVWGVFFAIPLATLGKALLNTVLEHLEAQA